MGGLDCGGPLAIAGFDCIDEGRVLFRMLSCLDREIDCETQEELELVEQVLRESDDSLVGLQRAMGV